VSLSLLTSKIYMSLNARVLTELVKPTQIMSSGPPMMADMVTINASSVNKSLISEESKNLNASTVKN